jgi:hypothetical protein
MKLSVLKRYSVYMTFIFSCLITTQSLFSQYSESAVPFLKLPPSAVSLAMGQTGVAYSAEDAFAFRNNPAHLGILSMNNNLLISSYPSGMRYLPLFSNNISFINHGFNIGYNFGRDSGSFPLSIGAAYMYQDMDIGYWVRTYEDGTIGEPFHSYETANSFSVSAALDLWVKIGFGLTYKSIKSYLAPASQLSGGEAGVGSSDAVDVGLLAIFPVLEKFQLNDDFSLDLDASLGMSVLNLGSKMTYREEADPLPRMSNIGYSVSAGLDYKYKNTILKLLKIDWTCEAQDILVSRDSLGSYYEGIYSDVNFIQNFFLLKSPNQESVKVGVSFSVLDIFRFMFGTYTFGKSSANTIGYGLQLKGMLKFATAYSQDTFLKYIAEHIDVAIYYAKFEDVFLSNNSGYDKDCFNIVISLKNMF